MEKSDVEHYVWADKIADQLKHRKVKKHVVHGMWTPSGFFHIGNARPELINPSFIHKSLLKKGLKSEQNFIIDDFDDFDKIPNGIDVDKEEFDKHLGKPLRDVPSPETGYESWAHFFQKDVLSHLESFGLRPNVLSSYDSYKEGLFDKDIRIVLDKSEQVRKIWNEVTNAKKAKGWIPVMIVCEECGKIATTRITKWNGNEVEYSCNLTRDYVKGCRYKGKTKPEKGRAKLPWRLHWAANWHVHRTTFESAGKDHFSAGGSVETSQKIAKEIFGIEGPLQTPTEFLLIDSTKLSGSAGNVVSLGNWLEFAEPELLRFMMISYKQNTVINFDLHSNKFFLLADRYDKAEQAYFQKGDKGKREMQLTEIYEFSQTRKIPEKMPVQLNYSNAAMIAQTFPDKPLKELIETLHKNGWIKRKTLTAEDKEKLTKRINLAKNWLDKYAPEDVKFVVQDEVPKGLRLSSNEKEALHLVASKLKEKEWDQKKLFEEFYNICEKIKIKNTDFFKAAYTVLLNKDRGPKLAPFILTLGKERVIELFEKV